MTRALRVTGALVRPPFAALLALSTAVGLVQAGHVPGIVRQVLVFAAVAGWMVFAVALNDLADVDIDRVNLPDDPRRVLANRRASRGEVVGVAVAAAAGACAAGAALDLEAVTVVACGLLLAVAYSLPPLSLSRRGILTSALLPLGYVSVPFLVGAYAGSRTVDGRGVVLLAGLYLGFMGRLVLKDFRDEHGDRLYGKRTTLVRHGRVRTCAFSAVFWSVGAGVALAGQPRSVPLTLATAAYVAAVVALLADVAADQSGVRDVANVMAVSVVGRALIVTFLTQMATTMTGWSPAMRGGLVLATAFAALGVARECRTQLLPRLSPLADDERARLTPPGVAPVREPVDA